MSKERFQDIWLTEAIHNIEAKSERFADASANAKAKIAAQSTQGRIIKRAYFLAEGAGIIKAQRYFIQSAKLARWILFFIAIVVGCGLALTVLATNPINIFWAISGLIGMHFIALIIWLGSFFLTQQETPHLLLRCWIWLTKRFAPRANELGLLPSLFSLLTKNNAMRWLIGCMTHAFWFVILTSATLTLIFIFSFKSYQFIWQTTLLSETDFIHIVNALGYFPSLIGFTLPNTELIIKTGQTLQTQLVEQHAWALWLIGIVFVYGVLIRFILLLLCFAMWKRSINNIDLEWDNVDYQYLAERLSPSTESIGIIDAENKQTESFKTISPALKGTGNAVIAIEVEKLPDLTSLSSSAPFLGEINDRNQRRVILEALYANPLDRLLILVDSARVPDRGMIYLIRELAENAKQTRIFVLGNGQYAAHWIETISELALQTGDFNWIEGE